jgi:hypothetical protein
MEDGKQSRQQEKRNRGRMEERNREGKQGEGTEEAGNRRGKIWKGNRGSKGTGEGKPGKEPEMEQEGAGTGGSRRG